MISLFISIVIPLIILGLLLWVIGMLPLDPKIMQVIRVVAIILVVLWLCGIFFGWAPMYGDSPGPALHIPNRHGC
jgi:hypothetical protein